MCVVGERGGGQFQLFCFDICNAVNVIKCKKSKCIKNYPQSVSKIAKWCLCASFFVRFVIICIFRMDNAVNLGMR